MINPAFAWILLGVAFVAGLLAATLRLTGRRRDIAAAGWGSLSALAAYGLGFREEGWYWAIPAGAIIGWLFTAGWDLTRDSIWPTLRPIVAPDHWDLAATRPPLAPAERQTRTRVALSAAAGASGVGLMVVCGFEQACRSNVIGPSLAVYLVISLVVAWLSARFLEPIQDVALPRTNQRSTPDPAATNEASSRWRSVLGRNPVQYSVLTFVLLVLGDIGSDVLKHGLQAGGGAGVLVFLLNSLGAGVVTYYWAAAVLLRAPSVARRATYTTTIIGALIAAPFTLVYVLRILPIVPSGSGPSMQSQALFVLLIGALIFLGSSILFGLLLFGLYAYGGGLALDRLRITPVAWRVAAGLLPVALLYTLLLLLVLTLLRTLLARNGVTVEVALPASGWFTQAAMAVGWSLGLWADAHSERALNTQGH